MKKNKDYNYEKWMKEYYKEQLDLFKEKAEKYQDLFESALHQFELADLQKKHLLSVIEEVQAVGEKYWNNEKTTNLMLAIIENWMNRHNLDVILANKSVLDDIGK